MYNVRNSTERLFICTAYDNFRYPEGWHGIGNRDTLSIFPTGTYGKPDVIAYHIYGLQYLQPVACEGSSPYRITFEAFFYEIPLLDIKDKVTCYGIYLSPPIFFTRSPFSVLLRICFTGVVPSVIKVLVILGIVCADMIPVFRCLLILVLSFIAESLSYI